ncbi:unnamed protein product [Dibothriocephalus latus]|uniref:GP-PDE domain-containing protein n=1 Tax=Dibothriocephalus latus TaxID=60516 RepID=A0A3P7MDQ5_DIBLA|nr:unnamed protein product [Dibothriocephalus latus]
MFFELVLALIGLYMILSFVLLRYPQLLHKRRTPAFKAAMICHRGGSGEFLENTMDAFSGCVELGCDLIELDCQLTKDEQVVVSHDNDLSRGTGQKVCVSDLDFKDLPEYSASVKVQFGFGEEHRVKPGASRRIPMLRSVFEAFPTVPINIDVKVDNDLLIRKVLPFLPALLVAHNPFTSLNDRCQSQRPSKLELSG